MDARGLLVFATLLGGARSYTLAVTTYSYGNAWTTDTGITFQFCKGGSYCDTQDFEIGLPANADTYYGETTYLSVAPGYEPTTAKIVKEVGTNGWCISNVTWESGTNLLGDDGRFWLDTNNCANGVYQTDPCKTEWKLFNLDGSDDYVYDVRIKACDGTSSSSIQAYFCSVGVCDGTAGEEELVQLQMNDVEGGWTDISFPLPFNPMGMRLEEPVGTDTWCTEHLKGCTKRGPMDNPATRFRSVKKTTMTLQHIWLILRNRCTDELTFNGFPVSAANKVLSTGAQTFWNIQNGDQGAGPTPGPTSGPTPSPVDKAVTSDYESDQDDDDSAAAPSDETTLDDEDGKFFEDEWEVIVAVIGAAVIAVGAGCIGFACRRPVQVEARPAFPSEPSRRPDAYPAQAEPNDEYPEQ